MFPAEFSNKMLKPIAFALTMAAFIWTACPSGAASGRSAQSDLDDRLLNDISLSELKDLLIGGGFKVGGEIANGLIVSKSGQTLAVRLVLCRDKRCAGVWIRSRWVLGDRKKAIRSARYFEATVPMASVSIQSTESGTDLLVGRDMLLSPGRTATNLLLQVGYAARLAESMTASLMKDDPGIAEFWADFSSRR